MKAAVVASGFCVTTRWCGPYRDLSHEGHRSCSTCFHKKRRAAHSRKGRRNLQGGVRYVTQHSKVHASFLSLFGGTFLSRVCPLLSDVQACVSQVLLVISFSGPGRPLGRWGRLLRVTKRRSTDQTEVLRFSLGCCGLALRSDCHPLKKKKETHDRPT